MDDDQVIALLAALDYFDCKPKTTPYWEDAVNDSVTKDEIRGVWCSHN